MYESSASAGNPIIGANGSKIIPPIAAMAAKSIAGGTAASAKRLAGRDTSERFPLL